MKVGFVTFGCRLNRAEALDLEAQYAAAGWEIVPIKPLTPSSPQHLITSTNTLSPDLIIVRGCSVTAKAQRDCEKAIAHLRTRFPLADIRISGCLEQKRYASVKDSQPSTLNPQLSTLNSQHFSLASAEGMWYLTRHF